jgi:hypothetical protein
VQAGTSSSPSRSAGIASLAAKAGALYLGINDARETVTGVQGQLEVRIDEAL